MPDKCASSGSFPAFFTTQVAADVVGRSNIFEDDKSAGA